MCLALSTSLFSYCGHSASHWQQSRFIPVYVYSAHIQCVPNQQYVLYSTNMLPQGNVCHRPCERVGATGVASTHCLLGGHSRRLSPTAATSRRRPRAVHTNPAPQPLWLTRGPRPFPFSAVPTTAAARTPPPAKRLLPRARQLGSLSRCHASHAAATTAVGCLGGVSRPRGATSLQQQRQLACLVAPARLCAAAPTPRRRIHCGGRHPWKRRFVGVVGGAAAPHPAHGRIALPAKTARLARFPPAANAGASARRGRPPPPATILPP